MSSGLKRRYDIGKGWFVEDNGHSLLVRFDNGTMFKSTGVMRPPPKLGDTVEVQYDRGEHYYYIPQYSFGVHGRWYSVQTWPTEEAMRATIKSSGLDGGVYITRRRTCATRSRSVSMN
jgi:hypothetical protein